MKTIEVMHEWTKERITVEVTVILRNTIHVRFPGIVGACIYELNVKTNTMRANSAAVRRKHPHCVWHATDVVAVQRMVWEHNNPNHKQLTAAVARHFATMPR